MRKAFTIIELLVAIGIFGLAAIGIGGYFAYSGKIIRSARTTTIASNLAEGVLEEQLNFPYGELAVGTSAKTRIAETQTDPFYNYQKQVTVSLIDSDLANSATDVGLKKIQVAIYYTEGTSEKNVQLATVKSER